ncbi:ABC transporter [Brachybacterium phenoliresistens]|uniref:ABC transporter n=1 Tax=Brachybacterium phenoliresistens TaxID=396014 RepID=Z9JUR1_9MICO|nr:sugar ABC transporter permease [Brachybacterium phenoliresistens]EWS82100.1 ABC transporter [Brachybacterium phenoliresistens]
MATTAAPAALTAASPPRRRARSYLHRSYPLWYYLPAAVLFLVFFVVPTFASFFFSLTRWSLFDWEFIGLKNYAQFLSEPQMIGSLRNTVVYAFLTSGAKVVLGMALGLLLTSQIRARGLLRSMVFFPVLVSTIGVGIMFTTMMHPTEGLINSALSIVGIEGPKWLANPQLALISVALVDIWKGVGLATVIYMAGITAIPVEYYEAAKVDGSSAASSFWHITLPLARPATFTVITLSLIGGLRSFDLIWAMTKGGPGFASDVLASVVYKQYQAGFYGLSTAGNVVMFIVVMAIVLPLNYFMRKAEVEQ